MYACHCHVYRFTFLIDSDNFCWIQTVLPGSGSEVVGVEGASLTVLFSSLIHRILAMENDLLLGLGFAVPVSPLFELEVSPSLSTSLGSASHTSSSLPVDLALLNNLLMTVRGGRLSFVHQPSATSFSLTSQEKIPGAVRRYSSILFFTSELTSLDVFLLARPGSKEPVSLYLESSLLMQPCETLSCLLISHGRMPSSAISMILWRTVFGSGLPFTNTPPSWLNFPCPSVKKVSVNSVHFVPLRSLTNAC